MTGRDQKQQIREKLLEQRQKMSESVFLNHSEQICNRIRELDLFKEAKVIHCYVSMNERREVNTHPLIKGMLAGSKKVVVPVMRMRQGLLKHIQLDSFDDLRPNRWHVPEPGSGKEVPAGELDLILVPMVAGDLNKNRMGYGGGYYDRFLQNVSCPAMGLLFDCCLINEIPAEPFDVSVTKIVTETQIIS